MAVPLKIFIAGATGFIGRHLAKAFQARGHKVYGLARDRMRGKVLEELGCASIIGNLLTSGPWERASEHVDVPLGRPLPCRRGQLPPAWRVAVLQQSRPDAHR